MSKEKMNQISTIATICIGALAIILSLACFASDTGVFERNSAYGGDAYTGIQNASAATANNAKCIAAIASLGFGSVLLITGLMLVLKGVLSLIEIKNAKKADIKEPTAPLPTTPITSETDSEEKAPSPNSTEIPTPQQITKEADNAQD